ncbi:MAG: hypothetical protein HN368_11195 [Spirochaetales bacterium]|nr:hypothetical protein [Spirochaetales bacterium]
MGGITASIIIFIAGFLLIGLFLSVYTRFMYSRMITVHYEAIDDIIETGLVPKKWQKSSIVRAILLNSNSFLLRPLSKLLRGYYIRKLSRTIRFIKTSTVLSESERTSCILELEEIMSEWNKWSARNFLN